MSEKNPRKYANNSVAPTHIWYSVSVCSEGLPEFKLLKFACNGAGQKRTKREVEAGKEQQALLRQFIALVFCRNRRGVPSRLLFRHCCDFPPERRNCFAVFRALIMFSPDFSTHIPWGDSRGYPIKLSHTGQRLHIHQDFWFWFRFKSCHGSALKKNAKIPENRKKPR